MASLAVILHPSPPSIAIPAAGGFACSRQRFRFGLCRTHRGRHGLRRSPGCRDDRRPADSIKEFYTGDRLGRDHWPDRVRLCLAWLSGAPDGEAVFGPHLHSDAPTYSNSIWQCTPCCRLWLWARLGPLDHLSGVLPPRRESHGRARLHPPP